MSWSYSGRPADSTVDQVRFLVGQTTTGDDVLLEDEEIDWALTQQSNTYLAAALCAETLQARYGLEADDLVVGQTRVAFSGRADRYGKLAVRLRQQAVLRGVSPFVGGVSESDKETREDNSDTIFPFGKIEDMDHTGVSDPYST